MEATESRQVIENPNYVSNLQAPHLIKAERAAQGAAVRAIAAPMHCLHESGRRNRGSLLSCNAVLANPFATGRFPASGFLRLARDPADS
jgi:hypothetical protein